MPLALVVALIASLGIHAAVLFGPEVELFGGSNDEPPPLRAELQPPPPAPAPPAAKPRPIRHRAKTARPSVLTNPQPVAEALPLPTPEAADTPEEIAPEIPSTVATAPPAPVKPVLPASGTIRYAISWGTAGYPIGRAEHHWEFTADNHYRLSGVSETSGVVALFKSVRFENESEGRLVAGGLQPERYRTRKNGKDANENADFDWSTAEVHLSRDGSTRAIAAGTQDILSLNYQLAYVRQPENGTSIGVVTGKKYERYDIDSLGEEDLQTPAGPFHTLHLRATTDSVTEIWIALDHHRLPVKIRFTDKKGDVIEQIATEIGMP